MDELKKTIENFLNYMNTRDDLEEDDIIICEFFKELKDDMGDKEE